MLSSLGVEDMLKYLHSYKKNFQKLHVSSWKISHVIEYMAWEIKPTSLNSALPKTNWSKSRSVRLWEGRLDKPMNESLKTWKSIGDVEWLNYTTNEGHKSWIPCFLQGLEDHVTNS
jgi:hypothetical protein